MSRRRAVAPLVLLLASAAARAAIAASPAVRCATIKLRAAARTAALELGCEARAVGKGATPHASCVRPSGAPLASVFARAETHIACFETGHAPGVAEAIERLRASATALLGGAGRRCAAAKLMATGSAAAGKLRCLARAAAHPAGDASTCLAARATALARAFAAAERAHRCAVNGDTAEIAAAVDLFVATVTGTLLPAPGASTTTTVTMTTSTAVGATTTSTSTGPTSSTTPLATTTTLPAHVSFAGEVLPILVSNCALSGCHAGTAPAEALKLTAARAWTALVNVRSLECPAYERVLPGSPAQSYLVFKLHGAGPCLSGGQMPFGRAPLSAANQATIEAWIQEGAPND
jgi:hypothetical protein